MDGNMKSGFSVSTVGGSDAYNRLQSRVTVAERGRPMESRAGAASPRQLRVLIVDDNSDAADTLGELVRLWGHDALRAYGGAMALATASATSPDVVLLDIAMPEMDGCELAMQLRKQAGLQDCFLIAVTGIGGEKHRRQCHLAGIDLFLVKPVEPVVLETLLMLERQRLGLSPPLSVLIGDEPIKFGAAQKTVAV